MSSNAIWSALLGLGLLSCSGPDLTELEPGPPRPPPAEACGPRAARGPVWLAELETVVIELECATGASLPGEAFQVEGLPPNASYDVAARRITFSPGLDQAGVYDLRVAVMGASAIGHIEVQVADRFEMPGNVPPDALSYTEEYGLPVLHLEPAEPLKRHHYTPARITYRGKVFQGARAKYRGQTSFGYPKKSFTLAFAKNDRFADPLTVAAFTGKRKVILTSTFDDGSYLRGRLAFELWNRLSAEQVQVQAYSVVVYVSGAFLGLYTLTDKVDGNLMKDNGLYKAGNLYKARSHDANFRLTRAKDPTKRKARLTDGLTKEEGAPAGGEPGASDDLEALITWVATSSRSSFLSEIDARLNRRDYDDWWVLVSVIDATDSASKNTFHYRDARQGAPDGRFRVLPWDFNESFGQSWRTLRTAATRDPEEINAKNEIFTRMLAEPMVRSPLLERLRSVLDHEWELSSVLESFDAWASETREVALRDEAMWKKQIEAYYEERRTFTTYDQEVAYMRRWIIERWGFVRQHFWPSAAE